MAHKWRFFTDDGVVVAVRARVRALVSRLQGVLEVAALRALRLPAAPAPRAIRYS